MINTDKHPTFPLADPVERERFAHHIEHAHGWRYRVTWALEADHPDGWDHMASRPDGWELNVDRWPLVDELMEDCTRISPGVIRKPNAANGPMLVAHWRQQTHGSRRRRR